MKTCLHFLLCITLFSLWLLVTETAQATVNTGTASKMMEKEKAPEPNVTLSPEQQIAAMLPSDEVIWLDSESGNFLALERDYLAAKHRGAVIFVSDLAAPINHSLDIEPLRVSINQYGFSSITIHAPSTELFYPPTITDTADATDTTPSENDSQENINEGSDIKTNTSMVVKTDATPYAQALIKRINSAHKRAASRSKNIILVIQGRQTAYLSNALIQQHLRPFSAVVTLDANNAIDDNKSTLYPATIEQLSQQLAQLKMPLLDIYHLWDNDIQQQMLKRKQLSLKAKQSNYRQHIKATYSEEKQLAKILYGWLKSLGIH